MENSLKNNPGQGTVSSLSIELSKISAEPAKEEIVIYDECGDTMWDDVLAQEDKANQLKKVEQEKSPAQ